MYGQLFANEQKEVTPGWTPQEHGDSVFNE